MSELWEQACQNCPTIHVRVKRVHVKDAKGDVRVANKSATLEYIV
jgi:hypothetical protein